MHETGIHPFCFLALPVEKLLMNLNKNKHFRQSIGEKANSVCLDIVHLLYILC